MVIHIDKRKKLYISFILLLSILLLSYMYFLQIGKDTIHRLETKKNVSSLRIENIFSKRMQQNLSPLKIESIVLKQINNKRIDKFQLQGFSIYKKAIFYKIFYNEESSSFIEMTLVYENKGWKIDQLYFSSFDRD